MFVGKTHATKTGSATGKSSLKKAGGKGVFQPTFSESSPSAHPLRPLSVIGGIDQVVALQEIEDPAQGHRQAVRRGFEMLDILEAIRLDLLGGKINAHRINLLMQKLRNVSASNDSRLQELIGDIELRAKVELAKLGIYSDSDAPDARA